MTHTSTEQPEALPDLLPCPFCGDHAETDFIPEHHSYAIECHSMGCAARVIKETAADAIEAWNRRTPAAQSQRITPEMAKHVNALTEIARMPNAEYVADAHNNAVRYLRGITQEKQG